ncbi:MAG: DEAD/DEAH box helicase family protein [Chloroflexi bacterium]|nr:DEAD/DEAH box helicase family protein [Chloroflexota bacterium]
MNKILVALDTETTGLRAANDAIIEIAAVKFRGDQVMDTWSSLVNPGRELPLKVERLTGITREQLRTAPRIEQVARHVARFVGDLPVVGHNVEFDLAFMRQQNLLLNNPGVDTDELARIVMPHASRFSLKQLAAELEIDLPESHRALADATTTMKLFLALCGRAESLDTRIIDEIVRAADRSNWGLRDVFKEIQRDAARNAFSGSSIGEQLRAKGFFKGNRLKVLDDEDEAPALTPAAQAEPLDADEIASLFEPGGALADQFPRYEKREPQIQMLRQVCATFNDGGRLLVEAGTGTGKSMAYLVPAIEYALANSRRVIISTNTINLQDQLIEKDIPDLRKILPGDFRALVIKGRSNYLCRHRFEQFQRKSEKSPIEIRLLAKVLAWLPTTTTGDRAELSISPDEERVWAQVCADETCNAQSCPYYQRGTCFFFRSRRRADSAHVLVVNHALLLSDMAVGNQVLPEYKHLIIDEAHHLEARATEAYSVEVRQSGIEALLNEAGAEKGGLLAAIAAAAARASDAGAAEKEKLADLIEKTQGTVAEAQRAVYPLFGHLGDFLKSQHPPRGEFDQQVRLVAALRAQPAWSTAEMLCETLTGALLRLSTALSRIGQGCDEAEILTGDERLFQLGILRQRTDQLRANLIAIINQPGPNGIYWAVLATNRDEIVLRSAPLHVGEILQKGLFAACDCVVLTSATLQAANSFAYVRGRLGLAEADELALESSFDYKRSTLLCLPSDIADPDTPVYNKMMPETLVALCKATGGRTMVLFTSKSALQRAYDAISKPLEQAGVLVMAQYIDGSRRQLLDNFKTMPRSVLLGTRSFWEGVDVAGDALSCLVITRLPFAVPSDPIIAARSETFTDAFNEYQVPQAILAFRQGFGRLIRSASDRGVVVMLDRRVQTKAYGKSFIASLPECTQVRGLCKDVPAAAADWLK